jgi:hypothetical protein
MVCGHWLPRSELDTMLERTAVVANAPPPVKKSVATAASAAP